MLYVSVYEVMLIIEDPHMTVKSRTAIKKILIFYFNLHLICVMLESLEIIYNHILSY